MVQKIHCELDSGKGRALVLVREEQAFPELSSLCTSEKSNGRVLSFISPPVSSTTWKSLSDQFADTCDEHKIRQGLFIGCGDAATLLLHLALHDPRRVRQLVLLDATTSPHPTRRERYLSRMERYLPMGLPFKSKQKGFDARSFLQRIRCPVLVLTSEAASGYLQDEAAILADTLPTAWHLTVDQSQQDELKLLIDEFQKVPARCPQKNRQVAKISAG